jgi:hypothetical protein
MSGEKNFRNLKTKNVQEANHSGYVDILQAGCSAQQIYNDRKDSISIFYFLHYFLLDTAVSRRATRHKHMSAFRHDNARATV